MKRSLFLFWKVNKKEFWQKIDDVFQSITYKDFDQKIIFFNTAIKVLREINQKLRQDHVDTIESELIAVNDASEPVLEIIKGRESYRVRRSHH